jgi:two-component system, OmpR family, response regulator RpaA
VTTKEVKRRKRGRITLTGDTLTSGQIAKLSGVAARTASKWIDRRILKGFRIPGSLDRRVYRSDLVEFLTARGMRVPVELQDVTRRVLLVSCGPATCAALTDALKGHEVRCSADGFAAGQKVSWWRPETIVVDLSIGTSNAVSMAVAIREVESDTWTPRLIALAGDDTDPKPLTAAGFDAALPQGDDAALVKAIRRAV